MQRRTRAELLTTHDRAAARIAGRNRQSVTVHRTSHLDFSIRAARFFRSLPDTLPRKEPTKHPLDPRVSARCVASRELRQSNEDDGDGMYPGRLSSGLRAAAG